MRRLWWATFVLVLVAGQAAVGMRASDTASVTGDEPFYLLTAQSLSSDGDLDLRDEYAQGEEREFWDGTIPLWKQMDPAPDGRLLSPHDPGLSLLVLPAYEVGGLRGVQRFLVVLWAAAMACGAVLARRAGAPAWAALLGAVVVGAGAPGVVYASQVYPEGPAALCVALGLLVATGRRARPLLLAAVLVALAWFGVKYVPVGAVVAGAWAWRFRADRRSIGAAAGLVAVAAVHFAWWHVHTFGGLTPYGTNVVWSGEGTASILGSHVAVGGRAYRLYGLFLDARFGLVRWLPAAALAVCAVGRANRSVHDDVRRAGAAVHRTHGPPSGVAASVAVLAVCVLMGAFVSITMMGWWFPGRMLVTGFPAVVVLVSLGAARLPRTAAVLGGWSLLIAAAVVWGARTGGVSVAIDPFALGLPLPPAGLFPDFRTFGARTTMLTVGWLAGLTALWWRTARHAPRPAPVAEPAANPGPGQLAVGRARRRPVDIVPPEGTQPASLS